MIGDDRLHPFLGAQLAQAGELGFAVRAEAVDRDHDRYPKAPQILDVPLKIGKALLQRRDILLLEAVAWNAAMHLERAYRGDDDRRCRFEPGLAAFDVEELLRAEIRSEPGLGHDIVGELQRRPGGDRRIAAMGDVGEGATMNKGWVVLQRL